MGEQYNVLEKETEHNLRVHPKIFYMSTKLLEFVKSNCFIKP